jgi:membrane protein required for colicin V production
MFGMLFGLARGVVLVTLIVLLLGFTPFPREPWWHQSQLLPGFQQAAQWASAHMPPEVTQHLDLRGLLPALPGAQTPAKPGAPAAPGPTQPGSAQPGSVQPVPAQPVPATPAKPQPTPPKGDGGKALTA